MVLLQSWVSEVRKEIHSRLIRSEPPHVGEFDAESLRVALLKGKPQVGATRYEPNAAVFEFAFPDPLGAAALLTVRVSSPERIIFMPVPNWVIENIWQGDVDGSYRFEIEAEEQLKAFRSELTPEANAVWFGPRMPKRRE